MTTKTTTVTEPAATPGSSEANDANGVEFRMWGGRHGAGPAATLDELNRSLPVDQRLWAEDVEGSRAWVQALARAGVLDRSDASELDRGLKRVAERLAAGAAVDADDEDIHTLVERLLHEEIGAVAGKLHTGRSRNDQVATDTRLWAVRRFTALERELSGLQAALLDRASATVDLIMPSFSHLRRAQPVRVAHWLLVHFWAFQRDRERLLQSLERTAVLPLGSGAAAGAGFPVDRTLLKELLGFRSIAPNSLDAVGDRDWVCDLIYTSAMIGMHLSRLAEDLIVFSTDEFGYMRLPDAYTTGSSLMPQKRNPDGLELARGSAARLIGDLTAALTMLKGLPTGYNKDLQEDKRLLFSTADVLGKLLPATRETVAGLIFDGDALAAAASDESLLATDLADALVRRGVPFRQAHTAVGMLLRDAEATGVPPSGLSDERWAAAHPAFVVGGRPVFTAESSVDARAAAGGTARSAVVAQIQLATAALQPAG